MCDICNFKLVYFFQIMSETDASHYQLQGTWSTASGAQVNYLVLKPNLDSEVNITNVYFNVDTLRQFKGCEYSEPTSKYAYINIVNLITEFPTSEIVSELFRQFLSDLQPTASFLVNNQLNKTRIIESKVSAVNPSITKDVESDSMNNDRWNPDDVAIDNESKPKYSCDETRFLEICLALRVKTTLSDHFTVSGSHATCLYCSQIFSCPHNDMGDDYDEDNIIDHIIVEHFNSSAFTCHSCQEVLGSKSIYHHHKHDHTKQNCSRFHSKYCNYSPNKEKLSRSKTRFECDKCQMVFVTKKMKLQHIRYCHKKMSIKKSSTGDATGLMCPTCGERKNSETNLAQHIKKFHENAYQEPIVCNLCSGTRQLRNRKYYTPYSYELHIRQIHRYIFVFLLQEH